MGLKDWRPSQEIDEAEATEFAAWASQEISNSLGVPIGFVPIPPGTFLMGSKDGYGNERPVHKVALTRWIWLQQTQTTQAQWRAVMGTDPSRFEGPDLPVEQVSWVDCMEFIRRLNTIAPGNLLFDLPTEAEWEYACRAGSKSSWCFGNDEKKLKNYAWYSENAGDRTHPVGQLEPNSWNLFDMHGNVWEWCRDWYGEYNQEAETDPLGPVTGEGRVLRGGSWYNLARGTRSAGRNWLDPTYRGRCVGVRLALR